jgi:hypothetical protein
MSKYLKQYAYRFSIEIGLRQISVSEIGDLSPAYAMNAPSIEGGEILQQSAACSKGW